MDDKLKILQLKMVARQKLLVLLICGAFCCWSGVATAVKGQAQQSVPPFDFQGRYLISVSDADMVPSAYVDGKLGPVDGADALSVIRLDRPGRELRAVEIPLTNAVTGPPAVIAVTPDGRYAIVAETRGSRSKTATKLSDLAPGRTLSVVDLSDPDNPKVVQRVEGLEQPLSISLNRDGSLLAVSYDPAGAGKTTPLAFYRFSGGKLSAPITPQIPGWTAGEKLIDVEWSPRENLLALLNVTRAELSLVRVTEADGKISLAGWGNRVSVEKNGFLACFTPDGNTVLANGNYGALRGAVASVRLAAETAADGSPVHQVVSRVAAGVIPEGLSVSPDGRWVVTTNLEQSTLATNDPKQGFFSSLTLLRLDSATGLLERAGDFAYDGVLPEAVVFDNSSRFLAVTNFTFFDARRKGGSIDFWRIAGDYADPKRAVLVKQDFSIPVTRGAHTMVIVR